MPVVRQPACGTRAAWMLLKDVGQALETLGFYMWTVGKFAGPRTYGVTGPGLGQLLVHCDEQAMRLNSSPNHHVAAHSQAQRWH